MARLELHPEVVALPGEDDGVLGGGAAGEDRAGLAQLRPGDSEGGRAVWRQCEAGEDEENSPGVAGGHSPPALSSCLESTHYSTTSHLPPHSTHWEVTRIVGRLHDADPLLGVEGTGVALAEVQAGGPGLVRGGVGGAGPAGGLAPLGLVGTTWALLALSTITVVHVARLTGHCK